MQLFFMHHPKDPKHIPDEHDLVPTQDHEDNTSEGSEFLDDALRMVDQPLMIEHSNDMPNCPEDTL